jgi:hypothetical protein
MSTSKKVGIIVAVIILAAAAFGGGMLLGRTNSTAALPGMPGAAVAGGPGGQGGPMANLTAEEQAELESMTPEERQAFLEEKMGGAMPGGGPGGPVRGGQLEGEVVDFAADSLTIKLESGSQNIYYDGDTVIAYQEGAGKLAAGSKVIVIAEPAADGVTNASAIIVKK